MNSEAFSLDPDVWTVPTNQYEIEALCGTLPVGKRKNCEKVLKEDSSIIAVGCKIIQKYMFLERIRVFFHCVKEFYPSIQKGKNKYQQVVFKETPKSWSQTEMREWWVIETHARLLIAE